MQRLTKPGITYNFPKLDIAEIRYLEKIQKRLSSYEDSGLEPEQVMELKSFTQGGIHKADDGWKHVQELLQAEQDGRDAKELYRLALDTWGPDAQTLMIFEEMSELQKELCKHARGKDNLEAIADEIADVLIMLEQMMILHDCGQSVMEHKTAKLKRLAGRLNYATLANANTIPCKHGLSRHRNEIGEDEVYCELNAKWMNVSLGDCLGNCESEAAMKGGEG